MGLIPPLPILPAPPFMARRAVRSSFCAVRPLPWSSSTSTTSPSASTLSSDSAVYVKFTPFLPVPELDLGFILCLASFSSGPAAFLLSLAWIIPLRVALGGTRRAARSPSGF
ncbi:hypothetical protein D9613_000185 [Agrocybe pediades]|uniref:Uncharacterized protein n=1 Tax=Agrocybe pediades TaxID=84607 RepID=A0A8H4R1X1_9AGAR|nr:hypothetical protein D9613_000185 [Agrocybe pediades]